MRHRLLKVAATTLVTFSLVTAPAPANDARDQLLAFLPGIDPNGNPLSADDFGLGDFVVVTVLVNTSLGRFTFSTRGCVVNESGKCHTYNHENWFLQDLTSNSPGNPIYISSSCYTVSKPCNCISRVCYSGSAFNSLFGP